MPSNQIRPDGTDQLGFDGTDILAETGDPCCCTDTPSCSVPDKTLTLTVTVTIPGSCCVDACGWCGSPGCEITDCCTKEIKAVTFTKTIIVPANLLGASTAEWIASEDTAEQDTLRICRDRSVTVIDPTGFCPPSGNLVQVSLPCTCGQGCCKTRKGYMTVGANLQLNCDGEGNPTWTGSVAAQVNLSSSTGTIVGCDGGLSEGSDGGDPQTSVTFTRNVVDNAPPTSGTMTANVDGGGYVTCASGSNPCPDVTAEATFTLVWS